MSPIRKWTWGDGDWALIFDPSSEPNELLVWDPETRTAVPVEWAPEGTTP